MIRPPAILVGIGALVVISAAAGYIVTNTGSQGAVGGARRSLVELTTTLDSGATVSGSGVILTASGEVVTSYDVVDGAVSIAARVGATGARYAATTFALNPTGDIAVLQLINARGMPSASLGDSSSVAVGDHVTAIGTSAGGGGTAADSQGAVTALGQSIIASDPRGSSAQALDGLIEFDARIPGGGAGGPLVDTSGRLIGLDTIDAQSAWSAPPAGVGYAIPINRVMLTVHDVNTHTQNPDVLQGHGAFLGIEVLDSSTPPGAVIVSVDPGTPAEVVGMMPRDVIVSINGIGVDSVVALRAQLQRHRGGDYVVVGWIDIAGRHHSASAQLAVATFT